MGKVPWWAALRSEHYTFPVQIIIFPEFISHYSAVQALSNYFRKLGYCLLTSWVCKAQDLTGHGGSHHQGFRTLWGWAVCGKVRMWAVSSWDGRQRMKLQQWCWRCTEIQEAETFGNLEHPSRKATGNSQSQPRREAARTAAGWATEVGISSLWSLHHTNMNPWDNPWSYRI